MASMTLSPRTSTTLIEMLLPIEKLSLGRLVITSMFESFLDWIYRLILVSGVVVFQIRRICQSFFVFCIIGA